jgi:predicted PurR-regulated permease PerM
MAIPIKKASHADSLATISNVLLTAFAVSALFFGREILVTLALAVLLTFMLAPMATRLQRWLGRIGSGLCLVALVVSVTAGAGFVLTQQAVDLANQLSAYKVNIQNKLRSLHIEQDGRMKKITETLEELKKDLPGEEGLIPKTPEEIKAEKRITPVAIIEPKDSSLEFMQVILPPVLRPLGTAGLVLLLLIFMLLQREDLRNRLIRLIGQGRIGATTSALDDAGSRVSRYLRMQLFINVCCGIPVAIGLYFIGIPNAILWGALATMLRFIPYVGPWIAAAFPILISLTVSPDWLTPLLTIGLFVVLELIRNNVMEPWLYGSSTGVSPVALIVAALFWTFLWGPVGPVLATPLTVCMVVMGRHIPKLAFLSIILNAEGALTAAEECYYRLPRAGPHDEMELVDVFLKSNTLGALYDSMLVPVITAAESDHRSGLLEAPQLDQIKPGLGEILDELEIRHESETNVTTSPEDFLVCCLPSRADRDEIPGRRLADLLRQNGITTRNASAGLLVGDLISWVRDAAPDLVCISAVPPTTITHARRICSRLRKELPEMKIVVGIWGDDATSIDSFSSLTAFGADEILMPVSKAAELISNLAPVTSVESKPEPEGNSA